MSKWKCNSCGSVYSDTLQSGGQYFHTCTSEVVEHAVCDDTGKVVTPQKRTPRPNIRNENIRPGVEYIEGLPKVRVPLAEDPRLYTLQDAQVQIISEGLGRTLVEQ